MSIKYTDGILSIQKSVTKYEELSEILDGKKMKLAESGERIKSLEKDLITLNSEKLSSGKLVDSYRDVAKKIYNQETKQAREIYEQGKEELKKLEDQDEEIKTDIAATYIKKVEEAQEPIQKNHKEIQRLEGEIVKITAEKNELVELLLDPTSEDIQARMYAYSLAPLYKQVAKNEHFVKEYGTEIGLTSEEVFITFNKLEPTQMYKIARKMKEGVYISSPQEAQGLPVKKTVSTVIFSTWDYFKRAVGNILSDRDLENFSTKFRLYCLLFIVVFMLVLVFNSLLARIVTILILGFFLILLGMLLYNLVLYSNSSFRRRQHKKYYTVGYFFLKRESEILGKIAKADLKNFKKSSGAEFSNILQSWIDKVRNEEMALEKALTFYRNKLSLERKQEIRVVEEFQEKKSVLQIEEQQILQQTLQKRIEEREQRALEIEDTYRHSITTSEENREQAFLDAKKRAHDELENKQVEIKKIEDELAIEQNDHYQLEIEVNRLISSLKDVEQDNVRLSKQFKEFIVDIIKNRSNQDKIPNELLTGIFRRQEVMKDKVEIYEPAYIYHDERPILITHQFEDEFSKELSQNYYSLIDTILVDMLSKVYHGAFRFVLLDNHLDKMSVRNFLPTVGGSAFQTLKQFGVLDIIDEPLSKSIEKIVKEQRLELGNRSSIEEVNKANKRYDRMMRYTFLGIRLYTKKGDISLTEFRKQLSAAKIYGIIPIIFVHEDFLEENRDVFDSYLKDFSKGGYYQFRNSQENLVEMSV